MVRAAGVGKANVLQGKPAGAGGEPAAALQLDLGRPQQKLHKLASGGDCLLEVNPDVGKASKSILIKGDVLRKGHVRANCQASIDDLVHGNGQDKQVPCSGQAKLCKPQDGLQVHGGLDDAEVVVQPLHEAVRLVLLADVGLHGAYAAQDLDCHRVGLGHRVVLHDAVLADCPARAPDENSAQRRNEGRDDSQCGVGPIHGYKRTTELHHGLEQGLGGELCQGGQRRRVIDEPTGELAAHMRVVERDVLLSQVPEKLNAEPRDGGVAAYRKEDPN
mmetsp:Transcript_50334/g.146003  ORF Transcript_50334/g.146003 Transcript_50334/m.146003 type:complete len:275 (-) Transcript_50334:421-1245(-)